MTLDIGRLAVPYGFCMSKSVEIAFCSLGHSFSSGLVADSTLIVVVYCERRFASEFKCDMDLVSFIFIFHCPVIAMLYMSCRCSEASAGSGVGYMLSEDIQLNDKRCKWGRSAYYRYIFF